MREASPIEPPREQPAPARRRVVVSLHGRRAPLAALHVGRLVADALGAPLHGLFACQHAIAPTDVPKLLRLTPEALEGIVLDVEIGEPAERLLAFLQETPAAFAVVEAQPDETSPFGIGRHATDVLGRAGAVIVVPEHNAPERLRRILLPLDGTPSTAAAIGPVGELARDAGAELDIVMIGAAHAVAEPEPGSMAPPQYVDQPQHEWAAFSDEFLHRFLQAVGHCPPDVQTRFFLGTGDPASEILRFGADLQSDILVLVWHGHLEGHHGEIFRSVLKSASRPVLVLRAEAPPHDAPL